MKQIGKLERATSIKTVKYLQDPKKAKKVNNSFSIVANAAGHRNLSDRVIEAPSNNSRFSEQNSN